MRLIDTLMWQRENMLDPDGFNASKKFHIEGNSADRLYEVLSKIYDKHRAGTLTEKDLQEKPW